MTKEAPKLAYLIDTSSFIQWWELYSPDVLEGFVDRMDGAAKSRILRSVREVKDELKDTSDDTPTPVKWAKARTDFFIEADDAIVAEVAQMTAKYHDPTRPPKKRGIEGADPFLIAWAAKIGDGCKIITEENPANANQARGNIHSVASCFNVACLTFFEFVREQGWKLKQNAHWQQEGDCPATRYPERFELIPSWIRPLPKTKCIARHRQRGVSQPSV